MRHLCSALLLTALSGVARTSLGDNSETVVPAGGGQPVLAARTVGDRLHYRTCEQSPCSAEKSDSALDLGAGVAPQLVLDVLSIGAGRHALYAHAPSFAALLAAPIGAGPARVLFSGPTGVTRGEEGERHGDVVQVGAPDESGVVRVLVGEEREDLQICGRPSILSPRVLDARDLTLKGAAVQRLTPEERSAAPVVSATRVEGQPAPAVARLLQATGASSAIGAPSALTDGDPSTTWSEQRGGDGRGEFVQMNAPEEVAIRSLSFLVRPEDRDLKNGVAPKTVWLASPGALVGMSFPEDAWSHPGAWYDVKLPAPLKTRCLALVLDEAYTRGRSKDIDVTIAEIAAHTEFDDHPDLQAIAGALAGGKERARMAASVLMRSGAAGFAAAIDAYPKLDDAGRVLALEVVDSAPCETSAPLYVKALEIGTAGQARHALDRIGRCGRAAAPPLMDALAGAPPAKKGLFAVVLAHAAPDLAVAKLVDLSATAPQALRADLRAALAHATSAEGSTEAIRAKLADPKVPAVAELDLLRSVRPRSDLLRPLGDELERLGAQSPDFRTRYLLVGPAAALAGAGEPRAQALLAKSLAADPDPNVRARAAEAAVGLALMSEGLLRASTDGAPRVREAALASLAKGGPELLARAVPALVERLRSDPWTFVRLRSLEGLAGAPASEPVDSALAGALEHEAHPKLRARATDALGRHRARAHADAIRDRLEDAQEDMEVRLSAARALGRMCDPKFEDLLASYAERAVAPGAEPATMALGAAAANGLVALSPPDLDARLAPLEAEKAPPPVRDAVKAARGEGGRCGH